jgi:hypothetical protein
LDNELIGAINSALTGDTTLLASGINPASGASRAVAIYGQPEPEAAFPYVRMQLSDTLPLEGEQAEPHGFVNPPYAEELYLMLSVFSEYEPETRKIAARLKYLLNGYQIVTANYQGWTWINSCVYFAENVVDPDRVVRRANVRVRCILEPKP